jgi:hypothetical protein
MALKIHLYPHWIHFWKREEPIVIYMSLWKSQVQAGYFPLRSRCNCIIFSLKFRLHQLEEPVQVRMVM